MAVNQGLVLGACCLGIGSVFCMVALGTVGWHEVEVSIVKFYFGLYKYCMETSGVERCFSHDNESSKLKATRSLVITGLVNMCIATAMVIYFMIKIRSNRNYCHKGPLIGGIINTVLAVLFNTAGNIVYSYEFDSTYSSANLGYSYFLLIVASIFGIVGSITSFVSRKSRAKTEPSTTVIITTQNATTTAGPGPQVSVIQQHYPVPPPYPGNPMNPAYPGNPMNPAYPPPPPANYPAPPGGYGHSGAYPPAYPGTGGYPNNPAYPPMQK